MECRPWCRPRSAPCPRRFPGSQEEEPSVKTPGRSLASQVTAEHILAFCPRATTALCSPLSAPLGSLSCSPQRHSPVALLPQEKKGAQDPRKGEVRCSITRYHLRREKQRTAESLTSRLTYSPPVVYIPCGSVLIPPSLPPFLFPVAFSVQGRNSGAKESDQEVHRRGSGAQGQ
jgi:hypothetical protein